MLNKTKFLLFLLLMTGFNLIQAQYTINSPYSRYGYGDLNLLGTSTNRGMGGTGVALREGNSINFMNPASYNTQDSMSFIWDFGVLGNMKDSKTSSSSSSMKTMNFDHLAFAFPITRNYFACIGILPYSKIGYNLNAFETLSDSAQFSANYSGSGNLNQLLIGNSFGLFDKKINIGFNVQYIFGALNYSLASKLDNLTTYRKLDAKLNGWNALVGIQTNLNIFEKNIILGATYQTKTILNGNNYEKVYISTTNNTIVSDTTNSDYEIPAQLAFGINILLSPKLSTSIDYTFQNWKNSKIPGSSTKLKNSNRINFGAQYTPDKDSYKSYFERIHYRFGAYYENSFISLNNKDINDYGASLGFGFPFRRTNTMFNTSIEYGIRGTTSANLVQENYIRFTLSVSLYDFWFIKKRYN